MKFNKTDVTRNYLIPLFGTRHVLYKKEDPGQRMELCQWITANPQLLSVILFADEASFTREGIKTA